MSVIIAVRRDEIEQLGAIEAIVLQQIRHETDPSNPNRDEWLSASVSEIGAICGLTTKQARRAVDRLLEEGLIERDNPLASQGKQTYQYRLVSAFAPEGKVGGGTVPHRARYRALEGNSTILPEVENNNTVNQQSLLGDPEPVKAKKPKSLREPKNAVAALNTRQRAVFEEWWNLYPVKKRKGDAMTAWRHALEAGVSTGDLMRGLKHYVESVSLWEQKNAATFGYYFAAPKFIQGQFLDFVDGPDSARWAPPKVDKVEYDETHYQITGEWKVVEEYNPVWNSETGTFA